MEIAENFLSLRNMVLSLNQEKPEGLIPTKAGSYAVIMETCYPDYLFTLVAISDGAASVYFNNGGGIIGAGQHPEVCSQAVGLLEFAEKNKIHLMKTNEHPLPKINFVRFYLITQDGTYTHEALENDLGNNQSELSELFFCTHKLLTSIREAEEGLQKQG